MYPDIMGGNSPFCPHPKAAIATARQVKMGSNTNPPSTAMTGDPMVGYHYYVTFLLEGNKDDPVDIRFQKVSGISAQVGSFPVNEGGENLFTHRLPNRISYNNLVLERGFLLGAKTEKYVHEMMTHFSFKGHHVIVSVLDENSQPTVSWVFMSAYPVKWSISDLAADQNSVIIESMELAYTRFERLAKPQIK